MGDQRVSTGIGGSEIRNFTKSVLRDLQALERMLDEGMLEEDKLRIGAEQEMFWLILLCVRLPLPQRFSKSLKTRA